MYTAPVVRALLLTLSCVTIMLVHVDGHGRLWEPPSRSSMWRRQYRAPINYQDNELFCGGVPIQYQKNGGKCGVCGDPWNGPRENEAGGKYAKGIITRKYDVGQVMNVTVDLTANHKGYFEFRLCPTDNPSETITQICLDEYPLSLVSTGLTRFMVPPTNADSTYIHMQVRLPNNVRCRACVFQWKYNAGNGWGTNPDGTSCVGCGNQEQFYGCSDIAIGQDNFRVVQPSETPISHVEPPVSVVDNVWTTERPSVTVDVADTTMDPNIHHPDFSRLGGCTCSSGTTVDVFHDNIFNACFVTITHLFTFAMVT